jgi:uncharacterized protein YjbI with pentapeptide repeats
MLRYVLCAAIALAALAPAAFAQPITSEAERAHTIKTVEDGRLVCIRCDLFQADFSYRDMEGRNFSGARLRQANVSLATLDRLNASGADLSVLDGFGARFTGANLSRANLDAANLVGAYLGGANLRGSSMKGSVLAGADMATARGLTQAQLNTACGDATTRLPPGLSVPACRGLGATP